MSNTELALIISLAFGAPSFLIMFTVAVFGRWMYFRCPHCGWLYNENTGTELHSTPPKQPETWQDRP